MPKWLLVGIAVLAMGCGEKQSEFVPAFTALYCDTVLECGDPAVLTFDGVDSPESCAEFYEWRVAGWGKPCGFDYKGGKAKKCLAAMETMSCPAEGEDVSTMVPAECAEVFKGCDNFDPWAVTPDEGDGDTTTGTDTGL